MNLKLLFAESLNYPDVFAGTNWVGGHWNGRDYVGGARPKGRKRSIKLSLSTILRRSSSSNVQIK